jgi:hypothetical protein
MQEGGGGKEQNQHHDGVRKYRQLVQQHPLEVCETIHIIRFMIIQLQIMCN